MDSLSKETGQRRKILVVLPTSIFGGAERVTYNIIKGINSINTLEVTLLTQAPMNKYYAPLGIKIHNFEDYRCTSPDISLKTIVSYARAINTVAKAISPSLIFGVMHFASLFITVAGDMHPKLRRILLVTSIHGTYSSHFESVNRQPTFKEKLLIHYLLKRLKGIVVPSMGIRSDIIRHFGVKKEKFKVIYNGFDLEWIRRCGREDIPMAKDCPWMVAASRLGPPKDFHTLLRAFRIVRDEIKVKLLIIGDGPYEQEIREEITGLGLNEDVSLLGFQENPFKYIKRADLFVLSSLSEGLPGALIEAMSLGIPVVSTDCPSGPGEIIDSGKNGIIVPMRDEYGLASACLSVFRDSRLRNRLSAGGIERAGYFTIDRMSAEYNDYFVQLLSN